MKVAEAFSPNLQKTEPVVKYKNKGIIPILHNVVIRRVVWIVAWGCPTSISLQTQKLFYKVIKNASE